MRKPSASMLAGLKPGSILNWPTQTAFRHRCDSIERLVIRAGMRKRAKADEQELRGLEEEFQSLLLSCLRECAQGRWGLFGQNDHHPESKWLNWPEAKRLRQIALRIRTIRLPFGDPNELCERFLELCSLQGSNVRGEPGLAESFLRQLNSDPGGWK